MNCLRCNGFAVSDDSISLEVGPSSKSHGWRCVNCGMISDNIIRHNQMTPPTARMSKVPGHGRHTGLARQEPPLRCASR
jgi:hypothetical protein